MTRIWLKNEEGLKNDEGKPRYELMPVKAFEEIIKVLTHGAKKYDDFNWRFVKDFQPRYYGAAMRHMEAWRKYERTDESSYHHLAHAIASLLFILDRELREESTCSD